MTRKESFADGWRFFWGLFPRLLSPEFSKWAYAGFFAALIVADVLASTLYDLLSGLVRWVL